MSLFGILADYPWLPPLAAVLLLLVGWLVYRYIRSSRNALQRVIADIAFERYHGLVIPAAHEGEIQIDELLLTSSGLLVLEVKDVQGVVFGSEKMQDWTVMSEQRRYTIPNPQPAMFDRIAAVRAIYQGRAAAGEQPRAARRRVRRRRQTGGNVQGRGVPALLGAP